MGNRLVIAFSDGEKELCNCCWHWSADTESALSLLADFWDAYRARSEGNALDCAVGALADLGAGFTDKEWQRISDENLLGFQPVRNETNRNAGLIGVSGEGRTENIYYADAVVDVNLSEDCVSFDVLWQYENAEKFSDALVELGATEERAAEITENIRDIGATDPCFFNISEARNILALVKENPQGVRSGAEYYLWMD